MKSRMLALAVALTLLAFGLSGHAQQGPQAPPAKPPANPGEQPPPPRPADQQRPPTFRAGVNFVRVDVIVSDKKGEPVGDLKETDFEVTEDGKPQKIETFKLVSVDTQPELRGETPRPIRTAFDEETEAARDDVRLFAIFLDDYHVRLGNSMVVREPLSRFIQMRLAPQDMVALMYPLTPVGDLFFTRDREATVRAIQKFEGRKFDYHPRNSIEEKYALYPAMTVEKIRNDVTLSALRGLVTRLGALREGRKTVILVSEGFTNMLPPQLRDPIAAFPGMGNPARNNPMAGENDPNEERAAFFASTDLLRDLRDVFDDANRNNAAIYALDPRGLATNEFGIEQNIGQGTDRNYLNSTMDTLRVLADQTDGRAIVNRNDLEGGLRQIIRDSSAYYLLGYNSTEAPTDGRFHEIKVKVKRSGVQVRARKGYWALTAEDKARALAPPTPGLPAPIMQALASIAVPPRGRLIRSWVGTSRGENGRTKVTFVWEPIPAEPGTTRRQEPDRVSLTASAASGEDYFRGRLARENQGEAGQKAGAPATPGAGGQPAQPAGGVSQSPPPSAGSRATFEAEPGRMQLRITVEGPRSEVLDSEVRDVVVPDLTVPQLAISTPVVLRARNAREFRLIAAEPDPVPVVAREFSRAERLLIRFDVYAPGDAVEQPTARLLNRAGTPMTTVAVQAQPGAAKSYFVDLPLSGLAAGEYLLELAAKASAGDGGEVKQLVAMRITN